MASGEKVVYFPGLNGIRAIAACGVMFSHTLLALNRFHGHQKGEGLDLAGHGVTMFFTLSGFLITYLLLEERERLGRIDFGAFYLRRILRIWPLYFLYIGLAMGYHHFFNPSGVANASYVLLFVLFVPNIAYNLNRYMPDTAALWSIGVEEQFYAAWPFVISRVSKLRRFLCAVIIGLCAIRISVHLLTGPGRFLVKSMVDSLGYDAMAIGALFALLYREKNASILRWSKSLVPQFAFAVLVALLALNALTFLSLLGPLLTSILTGLFILTQIGGTRKVLDLERPVLNYLGRISYGIYVYHLLIITLTADVIRRVAPSPTVPVPVILLLVSAVTIGIADLSYRYFERPFLKLKESLARIRTQTTEF